MKRRKSSFVRKTLFVLTIIVLISGTENQLLSTGKIFTESGKTEYWAVIVGIADYRRSDLDLLPHSNLSYLYRINYEGRKLECHACSSFDQ